MKEKRDGLALFFEILCWLFLLAAEFCFLLSFLPWEVLWVFLILTVLVLLFAVGRRKLSQRKALLRTAGAILAAVILLTGYFCFSNASRAAAELWSTDDPAHYERVQGGPFPVRETERGFFPRSIPDYAAETKFHFHPGFLQGGTVLSLEFTAPPEEAKNWEAAFQEKADYPGSYLDQGMSPEAMAVLLGCSEKLRAYVIYAKTQEEDNPPLDHASSWNHGQLYVGAVDPETNRVYFYRSTW